jgi:hypothetical protein
MCLTIQARAQETSTGEQYLGTWTGTWEGGGSGGLEVTLEKDDKGALTGKVSVTGDPEYKAAFKALSFDGNKMTAKYDFPLNEEAEVILTASFTGNSASGTWTAREKASGNDIVSGTWNVTRKQG